MAEPLRLLVVGCGGIARAYAEALPQVPALQVAALVDPVATARTAFATATTVPGFDDVDELLAAGLPLDAALVLTPPDSHEAICTTLLGNGLHVLCEKPLAPTLAGAMHMQAAARDADRRLMLGSKFRHAEDVAAARELLLGHAIGQVVRFENVFCSRVDMSRRWNGQLARAGGGVLMDNGSHAFDLARFLFGPLARVQATFAPQVQTLDVEDTVHLQFVTDTGVLGTSDLSWSLQVPTPSFATVHGSDGTIEVGWRQSRWRRGAGDWQPLGQGFQKVAAFAAQLADFVAACRGDSTPRIDEASALAAVHAVDAAYRSAAERRWVDLPRQP